VAIPDHLPGFADRDSASPELVDSRFGGKQLVDEIRHA
jgi:hypothetical protein